MGIEYNEHRYRSEVLMACSDGQVVLRSEPIGVLYEDAIRVSFHDDGSLSSLPVALFPFADLFFGVAPFSVTEKRFWE